LHEGKKALLDFRVDALLLLRPGLGEPAPPGGARVSERRRAPRGAGGGAGCSAAWWV